MDAARDVPGRGRRVVFRTNPRAEAGQSQGGRARRRWRAPGRFARFDLLSRRRARSLRNLRPDFAIRAIAAVTAAQPPIGWKTPYSYSRNERIENRLGQRNGDMPKYLDWKEKASRMRASRKKRER